MEPYHWGFREGSVIKWSGRDFYYLCTEIPSDTPILHPIVVRNHMQCAWVPSCAIYAPALRQPARPPRPVKCTIQSTRQCTLSAGMFTGCPSAVLQTSQVRLCCCSAATAQLLACCANACAASVLLLGCCSSMLCADARWMVPWMRMAVYCTTHSCKQVKKE